MTLTSFDEISQAINVFFLRVGTHGHDLALHGLSALCQEQMTSVSLLAPRLLQGRA